MRSASFYLTAQRCTLILSLCLCLGLSSGLFPLHFLTRIFWCISHLPLCAVCCLCTIRTRVVFCVLTLCTDILKERTLSVFRVMESVQVDVNPESVQPPPVDGGGMFVRNVGTNKAHDMLLNTQHNHHSNNNCCENLENCISIIFTYLLTVTIQVTGTSYEVHAVVSWVVIPYTHLPDSTVS
jgi:hypothetical protein